MSGFYQSWVVNFQHVEFKHAIHAISAKLNAKLD